MQTLILDKTEITEVPEILKARKYGYARVSTEEQFTDNQIPDLMRYGVDKRDIFTEIYSGGKHYKERKELMRLLGTMESGDCLYIYSIDRLSRRLKDVLEIVESLENRKIRLCVTGMNLDLTTPAGKLIIHQFAALAEFELSLMKQRQRLGIDRAKLEGKYRGRVSKISKDQINTILDLRQSGKSIRCISNIMKMSYGTIHAIINKN